MTDARAGARELRRSLDLVTGVLNGATEQAIIAVDPQGLVTVFNTGAERLLGYSAAEMIGHTCERFHDPAELKARADELGIDPGFRVFLARAALGDSETRQWTCVTKDGRRVHVLITVTALRDDQGAITGYIKIGTDVTERVRAQSALAASELRFQDTFDFAPNGMMLVGIAADEPGRLLKVNPALCALTGYTEAELLTMSIADLTHSEHLVAHRERFAALLAGRPTDYIAERHWIHADGRDLWVQFNVSPRRSDRDLYVVGQAEDISARKDMENRLTHQALHDGLTGLPNRVLLLDRIEHALAAVRRSHHKIAVLFIDLDGFKAINDSAGHGAGDHALIEISHRLRRGLRPGDTVARLGGDEFVVLCEELNDGSIAVRIAERILNVVAAPVVHDGRQFTLGASIGVGVSYDGVTPEQLIRDADAAMYAAKNAGKGRIRTAHTPLHEPASHPVPAG